MLDSAIAASNDGADGGNGGAGSRPGAYQGKGELEVEGEGGGALDQGSRRAHSAGCSALLAALQHRFMLADNASLVRAG